MPPISPFGGSFNTSAGPRDLFFQRFNQQQPRQQSNNAGFQNLLGQFDPFRQQPTALGGNVPAPAGAGQVPSSFGSLLRNLNVARPGTTLNVPENLQGSFTQALAPFQPFTPGGQSGVFPAMLDYIRSLAAGGTTAPPPVGVGDGQPIQPDANAEAARLLGGAVASNPFVTGGGVERLSSGLLPELNAFNPAFFRYTSPLITQAMQGLFQSAGVPLAHQQFLQEMFRPPGI